MHRLVLGNPFAALVAPILLYVLAHKLLNKRRPSAPTGASTGELPTDEPCASTGEPSTGAPSFATPPIGVYEVFLSFRGVDTRKGFADHLYTSLVHAGIHVFRDDDELRQGDSISPNLLEAIKCSSILIPIISHNYASSKWCLQELVHMMECRKSLGHIVWPVFYRVEPADVRQGKGSFGEAFRYYCNRFDPENVKIWKQALAEVASLTGWESERVANGHEGELVKVIVQKVMNELKEGQLVVSHCLVGIDSHVEKIMELLNNSFGATLFMGIYGMGGIGKTTLVKVIYELLSNHFDSCTFIADVSDSCKRNGILYMQNKLVSSILRENIQLYDYDEAIKFISSRFAHRKVLIILDDVATSDELKALAGNPNWFGLGSRILITARNKSVLDRTRVDIEYELEEMDEEQSLVLFSRHAFRRDSPPSHFVSLSRLVVSAMGGLPLALKVVGSFLCGKRESVWIDVIRKIQKVPRRAMQEKLRISYEALDWEQRQIFLDIACLLMGNDARVASYMWDASCFFPTEGLEVLRSLSLINIGDNRELSMHDQMRDFGREIVRQENYIEPRKRSRLWDYEEALEVLEGNEVTEKIEAIYLEKGNSTRIADEEDSDYAKDEGRIADEEDSDYAKDEGSRIFTNEHFRNLPSLRFLHMSDVNLVGNFKKTFSQLLWLKWGNCSPTFEAINFHPKELVILDLSGSLISDRWAGWSSMMMAERLKVLNLTGCRSLENTSYLSAFERLEILIFRDCRKLEQIDPCIGDLETLISLDLSGCSRLEELPPQVGKLKQLKELLLDQTMIREVPSSTVYLKNLEMLSANDCQLLCRLPYLIGHLENLRCLSLVRCHGLREIPESIGMLKLLTRLDLSGCSGLEELPPQMGELEQLKELLLDQTMIREIPSSIGRLKNLEMLSAEDCELLLGLPDSIGRLVNLRRSSLGHCQVLREIPGSIRMSKLLTRLDLSGCSHLEELPPQIGELEHLKELFLDQTMIRKIPSSFGSLKKLETLSAKDCGSLLGLPDSIGRLVNLSTLVLSGCAALVTLPDSIGFLVSLRWLSLGRCRRLREIPNSIGELKLLTQLDLSWTRIMVVPESIRDLQNLEVLDISHSCIENLPDGIERLKKLRVICSN